MKRAGFVALTMAVAGLAVGLYAQRPAAVPEGSHIAYVSGQRVTRESNEGKVGLARMQALQQEKAADVRAKQQALELVRQQLGRTGPGEERNRLEQEEAQRRGEFERAVAQSQADIQSLNREVSNELMAKVRPIIEELVAGTDVQIVLQADGPVLWAAPGLDLTGAVIERLNATPVEVPSS